MVWNYARLEGYVVVTKDSDLADMAFARGFPPKVIWLRLGNCTTDEVEEAIRTSHGAIETFDQDPLASVLEIHPHVL